MPGTLRIFKPVKNTSDGYQASVVVKFVGGVMIKLIFVFPKIDENILYYIILYSVRIYDTVTNKK